MRIDKHLYKKKSSNDYGSQFLSNRCDQHLSSLPSTVSHSEMVCASPFVGIHLFLLCVAKRGVFFCSNNSIGQMVSWFALDAVVENWIAVHCIEFEYICIEFEMRRSEYRQNCCLLILRQTRILFNCISSLHCVALNLVFFPSKHRLFFIKLYQKENFYIHLNWVKLFILFCINFKCWKFD